VITSPLLLGSLRAGMIMVADQNFAAGFPDNHATLATLRASRPAASRDAAASGPEFLHSFNVCNYRTLPVLCYAAHSPRHPCSDILFLMDFATNCSCQYLDGLFLHGI
jgi:hypothetical protein